jgi:hypothetical protein
VLASRVARYLGCTLEEANLRITNTGKAGWIQTCGLTIEGWLASPPDEIVSRVLRPDDVIWPDLRPGLLAKRWWATHYAWSIQTADEIAHPVLRLDDVIWARLLPGRPEGRTGLWAHQALAWIIQRESEKWSPDMGREIAQAQSKLGEKIAAGRIHLWGRQPGSLQFKQIPNDLFRPSKYKVVVTLDGKLSTAEAHKQYEFEEEYKDDSKWHDIIFDEDEIRREWRPAGRVEAEATPERVAAATAAGDQTETVTEVVETAESLSKNQLGATGNPVGRPAEIRKQVEAKMRDRLRAGLSPDDLRSTKEEVLAATYECKRGVARKARNNVLSEKEFSTNNDN